MTTTNVLESWLLDTNILLRTTMRGDLGNFGVNTALSALFISSAKLHYTSQNLAEFWNVSTRPISANGFGLTVAEADQRTSLLETRFSLAPDSEAVHIEWRKLVVAHQVSGAQVHDARIVATMRVNNITHLLTLNNKDFAAILRSLQLRHTIYFGNTSELHPQDGGREATRSHHCWRARRYSPSAAVLVCRSREHLRQRPARQV